MSSPLPNNNNNNNNNNYNQAEFAIDPSDERYNGRFGDNDSDPSSRIRQLKSNSDKYVGSPQGAKSIASNNNEENYEINDSSTTNTMTAATTATNSPSTSSLARPDDGQDEEAPPPPPKARVSARSSGRSSGNAVGLGSISEDMPVADEELQVEEPIGTETPITHENKRLSKFSVQFDFDGDGELSKEEERVRDLFRRKQEHKSSGVFQRDVFFLAKEQAMAAREAKHFKKMTIFFSILLLFMLGATLGLVFVAVNLSKEAKVNNNSQFVANTKGKEQLSILGSSNFANQVEVGDALYGVQWNVSLLDTTYDQFYVGTIPKSVVEQAWNARRTGVQAITTEVDYMAGSADDVNNWIVTGNINLRMTPDMEIYSNFETTILPGWSFTVYCPKQGSTCAITQSFRVANTTVEFVPDQVLDTFPTRRSRRLNRDTSGDRTGSVSSGVERGTGDTGDTGDALSPTGQGDLKDDSVQHPSSPGSTLRRLMYDSNIWAEEVTPECWITDYHLSLLVRNHFILIFTPINNRCETMAVDVDYGKDGVISKKITILEDDELVQEYKDSIHPLDAADGTGVPLKELAMAIEDARITKSSDIYNIASNNCATFILDILADLDVEIDDEAVDFITEKLMESKKVVDTIGNEYDKTYVGYMTRRVLGDTSIVRKTILDYVQSAPDDL